MKSGLREKILRYQRDCYDVLWKAFQGEIVSVAGTTLEAGGDTNPENYQDEWETAEAELNRQMAEAQPSAGELALIQIRDMHLSMARMAEQQLEIERRVNSAHDRLDMAREFVKKLQRRLGNVEELLSIVEDRIRPPADYLTDQDAARLATEVKALANLLTQLDREKGKPTKSHYSEIFTELYRRYNTFDYKHIRIGQFADVLQFLADWKKAIDEGQSSQVFLQGRLF